MPSRLPGELAFRDISALEPAPKWAGHRTAQRAIEILVDADPRYRSPDRAERQALLEGFARRGKPLYGAAYDAIRLDQKIDLSDPGAIASAFDEITICEIKSTNQAKLGANLNGYFFNITAAELLTAQSLGERYRFVFVNTITREYQEKSLAEVFARARAFYPAWHIRF